MDAGNIRAEIDGGPTDDRGRLIAFGSNNTFQAGTAYTSGTYPVGAEIFAAPTYHQQDFPESQPLFSGTQSQIQSRVAAAREAIASFDPSYRYVLTGGPVTDYQTGEQTPGFNSNSVAATLLWAMGIDPNNPLIPNKATPGADRLLLALPQIRDLIQRRNLDTPEGDRIPLPPLPSEKRGDSFDGSYDFASLQPEHLMPAVQSGSAAQADPRNIRVLGRFIRAPDGSLVPAPLGVQVGNVAPGYGPSPDARPGSWDNSAPSSVLPAALSQSGGTAETDPRNFRILSRFTRAPDGTLIPAPLGVPNLPQKPPQDDPPVGLFNNQPTPNSRVTPSVFGLPDASAMPSDNMDDWFSRWVKPLLDR